MNRRTSTAKPKPFVPVVETSVHPWGSLEWSVTAREYTAQLRDTGMRSPPFKNRGDAIAWVKENERIS